MDVIQIICWGVFIILAFYIETLSMDLTSVWFGFGAIGGLITAVFTSVLVIQLSVFAVISLILVLLTRPLAKKYLKTNTIKTNADSLIGQTTKIIVDILPGERGEVKIEGKIWTAYTDQSETLSKDSKVTIIAINGNKLMVRK